ncbi:MAG: S8 family serine peptidase [Candidatus Sericytochromatia bacterium]
MKSILKISLVALVSFSCFISCRPQTASTEKVSAFENDTTFSSNLSADMVSNQYIIKRKGLAHLQKDFESKFNLKILKTIPGILVDIVEMSSEDRQTLMSSNLVEYAEPNYKRRMNVKIDKADSGTAPSGTISQVNSVYRGSPYINVAVVSTGVDLNHPALKNKLLKGFSTFGSDDSENDVSGVGTFQAGIITASDEEVTGIASNCKVLPIKAFNDNLETNDGALAQGIMWAVDHGANVVTFTAEGSKDNKVFQDVFKYAFNKKVPIVIGSGDTGTNNESFPANSGGAIVIGSSTGHSNGSSIMSATAPSDNIKSLFTTKKLDTTTIKKYASLSGSMVSATYAAGQLALIRSKYTNLDVNAMRKHLESTVSGRNKEIDPVKALSVKK